MKRTMTAKRRKHYKAPGFSFGWSQVELFIICLYLFGLMVFICFYGFSCFPFEPERVKECFYGFSCFPFEPLQTCANI